MHSTDFKLDHSVYNRYVYASTVKPKNSLGGNNVWILLAPLTYASNEGNKTMKQKKMVRSIEVCSHPRYYKVWD